MRIILQRPVISEKANKLQEAGKYTFVVDKNANKVEIKKSVEKMYGVSVESINTMRYAGKAKTRFTKTAVLSGRTKSFKKAIIKVADGEIIDLFGNN
jgi:large subunit ribosomal protein L23